MHLFAAMSLQMEPFKKIAPWTSNFSFPLLPLSRKSAKFPVFCKSRPSINQMLQKWSIFAVFRKNTFFAWLLNHFDRIKSCQESGRELIVSVKFLSSHLEFQEFWTLWHHSCKGSPASFFWRRLELTMINNWCLTGPFVKQNVAGTCNSHNLSPHMCKWRK